MKKITKQNLSSIRYDSLIGIFVFDKKTPIQATLLIKHFLLPPNTEDGKETMEESIRSSVLTMLDLGPGIMIFTFDTLKELKAFMMLNDINLSSSKIKLE